ncbi:MAG: hypothetical protein AAFY26_16805, partial [Cyanobacteria bacterium J06638_22]
DFKSEAFLGNVFSLSVPSGVKSERYINRQPFYERFYRELQMSEAEVDEMLDSASRAGKHNEFYETATMLNLDTTVVASYLIKSAFESAPEESQKIVDFVRGFL